MVMGPTDKSDKILAVERLATNGTNWPLGKATVMSYFMSRSLLKHMDGTADQPPDPPTFPKGHTLTDDEDACKIVIYYLTPSPTERR